MHGNVVFCAILITTMIDHFDMNAEYAETRNQSIENDMWFNNNYDEHLNTIEQFPRSTSVLTQSREFDQRTIQQNLKGRHINEINYIPFYHENDKSSCVHMPTFMSICPPGFDDYSDLYHNKTLCYVIRKHQNFPPRCPYTHPLPFHSIAKYLKGNYFRKRTLWLNTFRNITSGIPQYEWFEPSKNFGGLVNDAIFDPNFATNKNCLAFRNGNIYRVSCFEKYDTICMYSMESLQMSNIKSLCKQEEFEECIVSDYDLSPPRCFCKKINMLRPEKRTFCNKLAEPIYPFQSELITLFRKTNLNDCWIGLHKSNSHSSTYKWLSTGRAVEYTKWARPEECKFLEGAFKFNFTLDGWHLAQDRSLCCALCEVALNLNEPTFELRYLPRRDEIQLVVQNFVSIASIHGHSLFCFTDANPSDFKSKVFIDIPISSNCNSAIANLRMDYPYPGHYWCEAFTYNSINRIKSNTILIQNKKNFGNEFSLYINVIVLSGKDPFVEKLHMTKSREIFTKINRKYSNILSVRPMRAYFDESQHLLTILIHLTTKKTYQSAKTEYELLKDILNEISSITIIFFRNSEICMPDITITADNETLEWPPTKTGAKAIPTNRICLDTANNMLPVTRYCKGNFLYGAKWELPIGDCVKNTKYPEVTEKLFNLATQNISVTAVTNDLVKITERDQNKQPIDIHFISVIVEDLSASKDVAKVDTYNLSKIISNVMHFSKDSVQQAQILLNSTDKILSALDDFIKSKEPIMIVTSKLIIYTTVLKMNNIGGLALFNTTSSSNNFNTYHIKTLYQNTSFESLVLEKDLQTAVLLPTDTVRYIKKQFSAEEPVKLIIMIFYNDLLFTEQGPAKDQYSRTTVVNVVVPGFKGLLEYSIKVAFRMPKHYLNVKNCSHWDYGLDSLMVSKSGKWKTDMLSNKDQDLMEICDFYHMTHFGLLLQGFPKEFPYGETIALEILTVIGSGLSLIGIIPIFVTAIVFKTWRSRPGNVILVNFCIAITIQIIIMFSMDAVQKDGIACKLLGAALHYAVLSEFCWMSIVALLQYRRFVLVFKPQDDNTLRNCLLIGWGSPLVPVVITISVSFNNYAINAQNFCTVKGLYYIFGYLVPIIVILINNAFIFGKIVYSVSKQNVDRCVKKSRNYKLEILLALFLFFSLGMTWIFGIIGAFGGGITFTYLFCIFATLRGLVLFLFFIVGNKETRLMWNKKYVYTFTKKWRQMGSTPSPNTTIISSE